MTTHPFTAGEARRIIADVVRHHPTTPCRRNPLFTATQAAEIHLGAIATLRDEDPIGEYLLPGFLGEYGHLRGHPIPLPDPEVL